MSTTSLTPHENMNALAYLGVPYEVGFGRVAPDVEGLEFPHQQAHP